MYGYIYQVKNKHDNKIYIGKRRGSFDENYYGSGKLIKEEINKFGKSNFILSFLDKAGNEDELNNLELKYISEFQSQDPNKGYNLADGGNYATNSFKGNKLISNSNEIVEDGLNKYYENTIYYEYNYDLFQKIVGNRQVQASPTLVNSIKAYGVIQPIIVNHRFEIVDGQHRFEILKELGYPIKYMIVRTDNREEEEHTTAIMREMNSTQRRWKRSDYINYYAELGNQHYIKLKELVHTYSKRPHFMSMGVIEVVSSGIYDLGYHCHPDIVSGAFEIHTKRASEEFFEYFNALTELGFLESSFKREFLLPFHTLTCYRNFNMDIFIQAARKNNFKDIKWTMYNINRYENFHRLITMYNDYAKRADRLKAQADEIGGNLYYLPKSEELDPKLAKVRLRST